MHEIKVFSENGCWARYTDDPTLRAQDIFDDFECPECGFKGDVIGNVRTGGFTDSLIGIIECPCCEYEEEY